MPDKPFFDGKQRLTADMMNRVVEFIHAQSTTPADANQNVINLGSGGTRTQNIPPSHQLTPAIEVKLRNNTGEHADQGYIFRVGKPINPLANNDNEESLIAND